MTIDAVKADDMAERMCEVLDLDPNQLQYITLSFDAGKPVRIYVQMLIDSKIPNTDWVTGLKKAEVVNRK